MNATIRRYRPRGQAVSAFRYTEPEQVNQVLDWITRLQGRTADARVTPNGVIEVRTATGEEVSIGMGSFIVPDPRTGRGWAVYSEYAFYDRYEKLPRELPIFPDGEVAV